MQILWHPPTVCPAAAAVADGANLFPRIDMEKALAELEEAAEAAKKAALPDLEIEPLAEAQVDFDTFCKSDFRGGTDIVARLVKRKLHHAPIGKIMLAFDGLVVALTGWVFHDVNKALYSAVALYVTSMVMDMVIYGRNDSAGGSLSCLDVLTTLYFDVMHVDPRNPQDPVLKGHCQTVMTCALKNLKGCIPRSICSAIPWTRCKTAFGLPFGTQTPQRSRPPPVDKSSNSRISTTPFYDSP